MQKQQWGIAGTTSRPDKIPALKAQGYEPYLFDGTSAPADISGALKSATHVLLSIPPNSEGDPAFLHFGNAIAASPSIKWIGYFSTVGVYGDAHGDWVDEKTATRPGTERGLRRLKAEAAWTELANGSGQSLVIYRLPGIYGPGRSAIDQLKAGTARRVFKPGQFTNRIHVADIATAVEASIDLAPGTHIFNVTDDLPAPPQDVIEYGAELLGVPCPPATTRTTRRCRLPRAASMSKTKSLECAHEGRTRRRACYPTYVEGLKAIAALAS